MARRIPRSLLVALMVIGLEIRTQPVRWWHAPHIVEQLHLSRAECDEIDRLYDASLPAAREASLQAARAMNGIARQLESSFVEETLLELTQNLAAAQTHEKMLEREVSRKAQAVCVRRHAPEWSLTRVAQ